MKGKDLKKQLRKNLKSILDKISDDCEYSFVTEHSCFDGCSSTYYKKESAPIEINCALDRFLRRCDIGSNRIIIYED